MERSSQGSRPASESRASRLPVHLGSQPQTQFHGLPFPSQLSFPSPGVITFVFTTLKKTNILKGDSLTVARMLSGPCGRS